MLKWNVGPITDPLVEKSTKHDLGKDNKIIIHLAKVIYLSNIVEVLFQ